MRNLERFMDICARLSRTSWITAIRRGILTMLPMIMVGSIAVLLNNFPLPWYQETMTTLFGEDWKVFGGNVYQASFGIMSMTLSIATSYYLAREKREQSSTDAVVSPLGASVVSFSCFLLLTQNVNGDLQFDFLGATGMFLAIVSSLVSTALFLFLCRRFRFSAFLGHDAEQLLPQALNALPSAICTISIFYLFKHWTFITTGYGVHDLVFTLLQRPFLNLQQSFSTALLFDFASQALWFFGIHGNNIFEPVAINVFRAAQTENIQAIAQSLPPPYLFTKTFFDVFIFLGGSGSTLCLTLALFLNKARSNTARLARVALLPQLFNINEILIYGLPIVLNPFYFIPFLLTPIALTLISAAFMSLNLVPYTVQTVEWTTPIILGGYAATGSWSGAALQLINLTVGTAIYLPFVRIAESYKEKEIRQVSRQLFDAVQERVNSIPRRIIDRQNQVGNLARTLAGDLDQAIRNEELYLVYQPLTRASGNVVSFEALLRWKHPFLGEIAPPVIIAIAEESDRIDELGIWILRRSCEQLRTWQDKGARDLMISVNLSPLQLHSAELPQLISSILEQTGIQAGQLKLEITEAVALDKSSRTRELLAQIHQQGVLFAMDDFGMGHSSLLYIRQMPLHSIKIDGSLVRDVESDKNSRDIIASITQLCDTLHIESAAEYVETEAQRVLLSSLGVDTFQGYLYSSPMSGGQAMEYLRKQQQAALKAD